MEFAMMVIVGLILVFVAMVNRAREPEVRQKAPSAGKCEACGSTDTFDCVREARMNHGKAGAYGARLGLAAGGQGRFKCRKCGHEWVHGYSA